MLIQETFERNVLYSLRNKGINLAKKRMIIIVEEISSLREESSDLEDFFRKNFSEKLVVQIAIESNLIGQFDSPIFAKLYLHFLFF